MTIRVVVADDHPTFRSGVGAVLDGHADIEVVGEAEDGVEAVEQAARLQPDVVLLDLLMPGMGGLDACRRIIESSQAKVVVLTMSAADDNIYASLRAGALGYLVKDSRPEDIVAAVRAAAGGHALLGRAVADRVAAFFGSPAARQVRPFPELTEREREVLDRLAMGEDNGAIARHLSLSRKTVRNYVSTILTKLQVEDRTAAVAAARRAGLGTDPG